MIFELRMAWRETRPALRRFLFMMASVAVGVGALTGIKGFSQALDHAMGRSAKDLIAADLAVRMSTAPKAEEMKALQSLVNRGAVLTQVTETLSMIAPLAGSRPILCTLKAVDPSNYPFYGSVELEPSSSLIVALSDDAVVASRELLSRTGIAIGDKVRIGSGQFRVAAILKSEPDRLLGGFELGPRLLITRRGLEQSGLIQFGSRSGESFLFRLPDSLPLDEARAMVKSGFQRQVRIYDYRSPNPSVEQGLQRMANFLSLVGLLALLVGGVGVATTIQTYLLQKYDSIAVLKCLGARSSQIMRINLLQGLLLGMIGSLAGVGLGYLVQWSFPYLIRGVIDLPTDLELAPGAAVQGFLIGTIITLLFLLPPLLAVRKVRPARVFLRDMPETKNRSWRRWLQDPLPGVSGMFLLFGVGVLASWLTHSWIRGFGFIAGLVGAILILAIAAKILLFGLKRLPRPASLVLRHGLKNIWRPGNHTTSIIVSLGLGVGFVLTIYLIQISLLSQIRKSAPSDYPNLFLLGITEREKEPLWQLLSKQPGVIDAGKPIPAIPARLQRVNGKTADELALDPHDRRFFQIEFVLTWTDKMPSEMKVTEGNWWQPPYHTPMISVSQHAARSLKISLGDTLQFESSGKLFHGRVTNIREVEFARPGTSNQFIFSPGALSGIPASYVGSLRIADAQVASLQTALFNRFPNVTSIEVGQVLTRLQQILDRITSVIRFIALFAILAGVIILASSVASTRYQRIREAALLKTLGATNSVIGKIQATEFIILGAIAGIMGALMAAATANYLLGHLLETEYEFRWLPLLIGTTAASALAVTTGWLANRGILAHRPLEILREN
jgi:putative ABC transport system permease protein